MIRVNLSVFGRRELASLRALRDAASAWADARRRDRAASVALQQAPTADAMRRAASARRRTLLREQRAASALLRAVRSLDSADGGPPR